MRSGSGTESITSSTKRPAKRRRVGKPGEGHRPYETALWRRARHKAEENLVFELDNRAVRADIFIYGASL